MVLCVSCITVSVCYSAFKCDGGGLIKLSPLVVSLLTTTVDRLLVCIKNYDFSYVNTVFSICIL